MESSWDFSTLHAELGVIYLPEDNDDVFCSRGVFFKFTVFLVFGAMQHVLCVQPRPLRNGAKNTPLFRPLPSSLEVLGN